MASWSMSSEPSTAASASRSRGVSCGSAVVWVGTCRLLGSQEFGAGICLSYAPYRPRHVFFRVRRLLMIHPSALSQKRDRVTDKLHFTPHQTALGNVMLDSQANRRWRVGASFNDASERLKGRRLADFARVECPELVKAFWRFLGFRFRLAYRNRFLSAVRRGTC